jgi:hypothetical protein
MEVSKTLGETISIARKAHVDKLIESMRQEAEAEVREEEAGNEEVVPEAEEDNEA